jgi:hypothetical protein
MKDNIIQNIREIVREAVDWMHLVQDTAQWQASVNTVMKFRVLYKAEGNLIE